MQRITIIAPGRLKESFMREAAAEYLKRLKRYADVEIAEVQDEKTPDRASAAEEEKIKETEGFRILARIPAGAYVIALAIEGRTLSSEELAKRIAELSASGESHLCFIIGGSLGLHASVLRRADMQLSFSKMTFPHQLMRVILLEQIYRSFRINNNEPYHK